MRGLAITALSLSHFRSHRAASLGLRAGPVAVIGPNGAGKTNILEAASLLSPGRGLRRAPAEEMARRPEALGWKITASFQGLDGAHEAETWAEGSTRELRLDGKPAPQAALGRCFRILWLVPAMDRLWSDPAEGRRRFLDRIALSFTPDHGEAVLAYERAMRERNRLLKDGVTDPHWYDALEAQMVSAADAITANRESAIARLAAAEAEGAFPRGEIALLAPDDEPMAGEALAAALSSRRRDMAAGRTLAGPHRADLSAIYAAKGQPAALCSTGEQKALLISLILANARALAADLGAAPVLLLDEVAAHLDEARRAALYAEIEALEAQALMTGTEAHLFDSLGPGAQRVSVSESNGLSAIREIP